MFRRLICLVCLIVLLTSAAEAELVGWWKFDETTGTTARDASGNGHDGTLTGGPTWTAGKIGGALEFDGQNDVVELGAFDVTGAGITLAGWMRPRSFAINDGRVISKANEWGENDHWWMLSTISSGGEIRIRFRLKTQGQNTTTLIASSGPVVTGEWQHAAATWDGSTMRLYLNGRDVGSVAKGGAAVATNPAVSVAIGSQPSNAFAPATPDHVVKFFDGLLDDVRLYNEALSREQLAALMEGTGGYPYAFGPNPEDGALHEDTWITLSWSPGDFAVSHDVYLGDSFGDVEQAGRDSDIFRGNQTSTFYVAGFPGYAYPDGLVPGTTYYWRIDEVNDAEPNSPWKGPVWSFSIPPKTAYNPKPADGAEFVGPDNVTLSWTPGFGAKLHTVYFGDDYDQVSNATVGVPSGTASYNPGKLESEKVYYWRVDEFDGASTHKGNIWAFTTPGAAGNPQPANRAGDVPMTATLSWTPATNAASHQIYFGMDKDAVKNATTNSPEYKGNRPLGSENYDAGKLAWHTTYYWRVDAVYSTGTVKGLVWTFTTADFLLVDDFESYNDIDPPDPASNRIFDKWIDGFGTTTNGALVGNDLPPYAERSIVHGGAQSMPYSYDNNLKTSEATMTLVYPRDWTGERVGQLSLWFRGGSANAAERMYVALNGSAVVYNNDPKAAQTPTWTQWIIDLQAFADQGVNLTNVNTMTIGFGTKNSPAAGGSGKMYFDDIRLIRPKRVDPGSRALVAHYPFEDNTDDASGNGLHATVVGSPTYADGPTGYGKAISFEFDNTEDCVVAPPFDVVAGGITLSAWIKPESFSQADGRIIDKGTNVAAANDAWWMLSTVASGGQSRLRFRLKTDESATTTTQIATSGGIAVGQWCHAAATWDGASMILYKDGLEVGRAAKGGSAVAVNPDASVYIGNQLGGAQRRPWDGLIDEVRIYNRALSGLEIRYLAE